MSSPSIWSLLLLAVCQGTLARAYYAETLNDASILSGSGQTGDSGYAAPHKVRKIWEVLSERMQERRARSVAARWGKPRTALLADASHTAFLQAPSDVTWQAREEPFADSAESAVPRVELVAVASARYWQLSACWVLSLMFVLGAWTQSSRVKQCVVALASAASVTSGQGVNDKQQAKGLAVQKTTSQPQAATSEVEEDAASTTQLQQLMEKKVLAISGKKSPADVIRNLPCQKSAADVVRDLAVLNHAITSISPEASCDALLLATRDGHEEQEQKSQETLDTSWAIWGSQAARDEQQRLALSAALGAELRQLRERVDACLAQEDPVPEVRE